MISVKNLTKRFEKVVALNNLNCDIKEGSVFGLIGSNGSGKSTLLRCISGVFQPDEGCIEIDGRLSFENPDVKNDCYFISDYPFFYNNSTINNMAWILRRLYSNWSQDRFLQLCSMFPINPNGRIINMSKGMQRQAALILGLSTMPKYMLLDEIFDGLDPVVRQLVKKLLVDDVASRNMTVIIASHNLRELEDVCDHVGLLHKSKIILEHELDNIKLNIHNVQIAFQELPDVQVFNQLNIVKFNQKGGLFNLVIKGDYNEIMNYLNSLKPVFIEALPLTLEEVFISEMEAAGYDINNII